MLFRRRIMPGDLVPRIPEGVRTFKIRPRWEIDWLEEYDLYITFRQPIPSSLEEMVFLLDSDFLDPFMEYSEFMEDSESCTLTDAIVHLITTRIFFYKQLLARGKHVTFVGPDSMDLPNEAGAGWEGPEDLSIKEVCLMMVREDMSEYLSEHLRKAALHGKGTNIVLQPEDVRLAENLHVITWSDWRAEANPLELDWLDRDEWEYGYSDSV